MEQQSWQSLAVVLIPALATPVVGWVLARISRDRRSAELDALEKRLQLVERIQKLEGTEAEAAYRPELVVEIQDIVSDLAALRAQDDAVVSGGRSPTGLNVRARWQEFWLTKEQGSRFGGAYRGAFRGFVALAVAAAVLMFAMPFEDQQLAAGTGQRIVWAIFGGGLYLVIALAFRGAALRRYHARGLKKIPAEGEALASS